jgi:hypothetical protein
MNSQALDNFTCMHGKILVDVIDIINAAPTTQKTIIMRRLLIVSLAAFWEAFHEDLCREYLPSNTNNAQIARDAINNFSNPTTKKIKRLYDKVFQIPDITQAWRGNQRNKTGKTPAEFQNIIDRMMKLRYDTAHGIWNLPIDASDCKSFLATTLFLAVRTEEYVASHLRVSTSNTLKQTPAIPYPKT